MHGINYFHFFAGKVWQMVTITISSQKQPPEVFCKKRCSYKFRKIHRKTPVPECLFKESCKLRSATLLKTHRCFPVNFTKFSRTTFLTEHLWWLPLDLTWEILKILLVRFLCNRKCQNQNNFCEIILDI